MPKSIQNRVAAPPLLFSVRPGAFDIVAFGRSKFVHNFRQKIDPTPFPQNPPLSLPLPSPAKIHHPPPCSPKSSPFGPVRSARARSSHASLCTNPDFGSFPVYQSRFRRLRGRSGHRPRVLHTFAPYLRYRRFFPFKNRAQFSSKNRLPVYE